MSRNVTTQELGKQERQVCASSSRSRFWSGHHERYSFGGHFRRTGGTRPGFYFEDGGNPYLLSWAGELTGFVGLVRRSLQFARMFFEYRIGLNSDADLDAEIASTAFARARSR